jgi:SsrA-binding protein
MAQGKILANNKKARHDYFIEDVYEAGIVLTGTEIKSMRQGNVNLKDSYAKVVDNEMIIFNMHISPYDKGNIYNVDPVRPRKLLLHKKEIKKMLGEISLKGLTIVPLNVYLNAKGVAKLEMAVARGKKDYDKRDTIAKKDADRRMAHQMKDSRRGDY